MIKRRAIIMELVAAATAGTGVAAVHGRVARAEDKPRSSGPARGTLLAIGGGKREPEIQTAAIRYSGGAQARWVYIPTAGSDTEVSAAKPPEFVARSGALTVLHTRDRAVADSESFVALLRSATAVYFDGGRQWRLVDAYAGTRTERELRGVLDRDGLIAGTSAGATIQGSYLVRGSSVSNRVLMSPGHERGFGYLSNVAIDQHIGQRGRENDLGLVIAAHPGLLGIGIDERTAIIVKRDAMTVIGAGAVRITDGVDHNGLPYIVLQAGDRFDLARWQVL